MALVRNKFFYKTSDVKDYYTFCASIYVMSKEGKARDRKQISGFPGLRIGIRIDYKGAKGNFL